MIRRYCLRSLPDWFLCCLVSVSLCANMLEGFILPEDMYYNYFMMAVVSVLFITALFVVSYSRRTIAIGIPVLVVLAALAVIICYANGVSLLESMDPEENTGLFYVVVLIVALVTYLLTRTFGGCIVLCVLGALANAWIQLSLYPFSVVCLILFLVSSVAMVIFCRYKRRVMKSSTHKTAFPAMFGITATSACAAVLCASLVWFLIIAPLNMPTLDVSLINRIVSLEVMERIGISKRQVLLDRNQTAEQIDEDYEVLSSDIEEEDEEEELEETSNQASGGMTDEAETPENTNVFQSIGQQFSSFFLALSNLSLNLRILIVVLIVLLIAAAITFYCTRHRRWLNRLMKRCDRDKQTDEIYHRMRKKMPVLGIPKAGTDTPLEYADRIRQQTLVLDQGGMTWKEVSAAFSKLCYGHKSVSDDEYDGIVNFYRFFYKCARKLSGIKYIWRQFRL